MNSQKYKTAKFSQLVVEEKVFRTFTQKNQALFDKKGARYVFGGKSFFSIGPEKNGNAAKAVFQFGKPLGSKNYFGHITLHNLTRSGSGKVNRHDGAKKLKRPDALYLKAARKMAKQLKYELDP